MLSSPQQSFIEQVTSTLPGWKDLIKACTKCWVRQFCNQEGEITAHNATIKANVLLDGQLIILIHMPVSTLPKHCQLYEH